ncbi:MAG: hypothetical protein ACYC1C_04910 [Chloroflexota bacterium]
MGRNDSIVNIRAAVREALALAKCRRCGCLEKALSGLAVTLPTLADEDSASLLAEVEAGRERLEPTRYACLGCESCYGATATNAFNQVFPQTPLGLPECVVIANDDGWPPVPGEYHVLGEGPEYPVAVSTLADDRLAEDLARLLPRGLCIVGKTETENIGIDKLVKNVIANPAIRFLLLAGEESAGHNAGQTLSALCANGIDDDARVIGATGKRPILKNITWPEVEAFRRQVRVVSMVGCEDAEEIARQVAQLAETAQTPAPT